MSGDCCKLPPVQAEYEPKGSYSEINGFKTYAVGPENAKVAVVSVYDVFGYLPQILQGADLIASQGYKVLMPDFLLGDYTTAEHFAPGNEEKRNAYFSKFPGKVDTQTEPYIKYIQSLKSSNKYDKIISIGYCWGYKVIFNGQKNAKVDALIGCHPSFAAKEDGDNVDVPIALLPSQGEDMDVMNAISKAAESKNPGKNVLKHYPDMPHGWMAARGDLKGGKATDEYVDGYNVVAKFIKSVL
ncbi:uncharacterized protein L201_002389 [Kwoniella dendrophila CBS 6074]|uniref:Dienelactone hydrolase domain-containing protein n=1 Tax=Kwoniella dendrophila CBS 6074 TaxID=1295534 RepID=A0AAX4JRJ7_9TREE